MNIQICAETRIGSRTANEDSYLIIQGPDLPDGVLAVLAVADGIGGMGNGHVASSTALTTFAETFRRFAAAHKRRDPPIADWLAFCFHKANSRVLRMGLALPELKGMGTACTAAAITRSHVHVCHVGDGRGYLWREYALRQLTDDEWYRDLRKPRPPDKAVHNARPGRRPGVTLVNQAIGWQPMINPSKIVEPLRPGDGILLCTDGLTDSLPIEEIERLLRSTPGAGDLCRDLADQAAKTPNSDNVTLIYAQLP
ncbi:MAG: protein phosphatase 2C domain-containing protein [Armatimonadota bacterium]|nr:protein phosphatase 2C domain-containing protein [Armatimonadota bacterium]